MTLKMTNKRRASRSNVTPFEIKGVVVDGAGERSNVVLIWNISDTGLCAWTNNKFRHGDSVNVEVVLPWEANLPCVVRWCRAVPDHSGFLLGLESTEQNGELAKLHSAIATGKKVG